MFRTAFKFCCLTSCVDLSKFSNLLKSWCLIRDMDHSYSFIGAVVQVIVNVQKVPQCWAQSTQMLQCCDGSSKMPDREGGQIR